MKRILLSLAILALTATAAPAADAKAPVTFKDFLQQQPTQSTRAHRQQMPLHGNTSSKVYHASDCEHYTCKTCTAEFATAGQAEAAGFHACKVCEGKEGVATANRQPRALKGNPNSRMLHGPSCKHYDAKGTTEKFSDMDQAVKKGYRLCSICRGK